MHEIPISLQLYTVRDDIAKDIRATFRTIAKIGYKNVEGGGFGALTPQEYGQLLADNALSMPGAHLGLDLLLGPDLDKTLETYKALGVKTIIVPFVSPERRQEGAGYRRIADALNTIAPTIKAAGLTLSYHNHNFEFEESDGAQSGFDILLAQTDPALVKFELDTYWALAASVDPVKLIREHGERINLLHIKDMDPILRTFAPVGTGILPLDAILSVAPSHIEYLVVEQDKCTRETPLEAIKISYETLKAKGYS